ncbi:MAG: hypothetical protein H6Q59_133 [Firmicutes bacterium]|nr:hypothetical protein [Bacillota bacterium]
MKKILNTKLIMMLVFMIIVPVFWHYNPSIASAATPKFANSKIDLVGEGEVYQIEINNKIAKSTYKWSSSNKSVAKVSTKGLVTTVSGGNTTIRCTITYPTKKTKTITCKVYVTIPADEIRISNAVEVKGAHRLALGSTMNFDVQMVPVSSTYKTFWSVSDGDPECISIDDPAEGIITAKKAGYVVLKATAAKSATALAAKDSIVNDAVIIEVIGPKATVASAEIVSTTELKVVFDSAVNPTTVIDTGSKLSSNIEITQRKNTKGVLAADPGALKAVLSSDNKTLTITSAGSFDGEYGIHFTNKLLTTTGVAIEDYYKTLSFIDTYAPAYVDTTLDDTGMIANINFSEPMDFTTLSVSNAMAYGSTSNVSNNTLSILNNRLNYIASTDKKSLTINLSTISSTDYGKNFSVILAGLKDKAGNSPANYTMTIFLRTDNSPKPQAVPIQIIRTGYNTLTTIFDRSVSFGGYIQVKGGSMIIGMVDTANPRKVNYTLPDTEAALTGYIPIKVLLWNSFNVIPTDTTAQSGRELTIDFTVDKTNPVLLSYDYDAAATTLTLNFNKEVALTAPTGVFTTRLTTVTDEIISGTMINYTSIPNDADKKVIKLKISNMTVLGNYTFTLNYGLVNDSYKNPSLTRDIQINNTSGSSTELPGPYSIVQSSSNLNQISLEFANRLDVATAQNVGNYSIPGVTIVSAQVTKNTSNNGATVLLTVQEGSINVTIERPVNVKGVVGYNNSYTAIIAFQKMVLLKDNLKPTLSGTNPVTFDSTARNVIRLNFSEQVTGTLTVKVTSVANQYLVYSNTVNVTGSTALISLAGVPTNGENLKIEVVYNGVTDASGNVATMPPMMFTVAAY